jgi:HlyD family secretion protein
MSSFQWSGLPTDSGPHIDTGSHFYCREKGLDNVVKKWHIIAVLVVFLTMTGGAGWWYLRSRAQYSAHPRGLTAQARAAWRQFAGELDMQPAAPERPRLLASGFIEAPQVSIMSEVPGEIVTLAVHEGDQVQAGELLVKLDDELLEAQLAEAEAAVQLVEAGLARTKLGLPPEEIHRLEALLEKAEVARDWAHVAWQDALAIWENPQDLEVEIIESQARVRALDHQVTWALAMKDAAEIAKDELARTVTWLRGGFDVQVPVPDGSTVRRHIEVSEGKIEGVQDELNAATAQWWQAWVGVNTAATSKDWSQVALSDLLSLRESPQDLQAQVNMAWAHYEQARAAVEVAQAQLALARAGTSEERLAVAQAQITQARTAYDALATQRDKRMLRAPITGRVTELLAEEGETIRPGTPLLALVNLDEVTLTVYIPQPDIARVEVGQPVVVTVDSYPDREFLGEVVHIATEAEFTPRNVQTQEQRVNMVFAVKVQLSNRDAVLKPGMPADAMLESRS